MSGREFVPDRVPIGRQGPRERKGNFNEVVLGYTEEEARSEAARCLMCKKTPCIDRCPVAIDVPAFIESIAEGFFGRGIAVIKKDNLLPGICGRVCPQEVQCEEKCTLGKKGEPLSIGKLERFLADWETRRGTPEVPEIAVSTGYQAAVVGSGPAGLTAAGELRRMGHRVVIFEALHVAGGVLTYGIPEFRLPQAVVDREVGLLFSMGVEIELDFVVGKTATLEDLASQFDSVFIGIGAGLPTFMGIPGENLNGVYSANEFLTRSNLMLARNFPEYDTPVKRGGKVVVVGGGNVAMDSARTALRMAADEVNIVYRRSRAEMPARDEEIEHGEEEGVRFNMLTNPVEVLERNGGCSAVRCQRMRLGEPDESGRRRPVPIEGDYFTVEADTLIMAIGTGANPLLTSTAPSLTLNRRGYIEASPETGETGMKGVFAGGDIITGSATVIEAMEAGKKAAAAMHAYLSGV